MGDDYDDAAFVVASTYRQQVIEALGDGPKTPTAIAEASDVDLSHVSRALSALRDEGLVELLVAEDTRKGRIYGATDAGRDALETARSVGGEVTADA